MEHASTIDIGARKEHRNGINEDAIATAVFENHHRQSSRPAGVFVLCDGVGGEASGDVAAFLATTVIRKRLTDALLGPATDLPERFGIDAYEGTPPTATGTDDRENPGAAPTEEEVRSAIEEAVNAAHRRVQEYAAEVDGRPATTAVVCVALGGRLYYGWVGDSRAYLVNSSHGAIQQLTKDHAATNRLLEAGEIDDEVYARVHEDTTAITRALGGSAYGDPEVEVDFDSVRLFEDDVLLVTSDGLVDAFPDIAPLRKRYERATDEAEVREEIRDRLVTDDEIRDVVLEATDLRDGVESLVEFANDRGGKDNLSVTLARDPDADPSPTTLPNRGVGAESSESLTTRETVVESSVESAEPVSDDGESDGEADGETSTETDGESGAEAADDDQRAEGSAAVGDDGESPDERSSRDGEAPPEGGDTESGEPERNTDDGEAVADEGPTAALVIAGHDNVYQLEDGFTIGRGEVEGSDNPNVGLVVDDDADIETHHARFEHDDGDWRVRDISTSGTFVEGDDGDWRYLLSDEGLERSRERGFDPESAEDGVPDETHRLRDGTAITLHHPRDRQSLTLRFFASAERARRGTDRDGEADPAGR